MSASRRTRAAVLSVLAALGAAGCSGGGPEKTGDDIPKGLGRIVFPVWRDGGRHKAIHFAWVLYPMDRAAAGTSFMAYAEARKEFVNPDLPPGDPVNRDSNVIVQQVPPGRYGLDIYGEGGCARRTDIVVTEGKADICRVELETGGAIEGIVLGPATGRPMPGVIVFRPLDAGYGQDMATWDPARSEAATRAARTREDGVYYIPNLPPGEHLIVYYGPGVGWTTKTVNVIAGKKLMLKDVTLEVKGTPGGTEPPK